VLYLTAASLPGACFGTLGTKKIDGKRVKLLFTHRGMESAGVSALFSTDALSTVTTVLHIARRNPPFSLPGTGL
jgi:hypothetical protein